MKQPTLFDAPDESAVSLPADQPARDFAVDPGNDVVLEASAGTGKTRVLVDRYVRLVLEGVEPRNILAITFTRKAAAEMRGRVLAGLSQRAANGTLPAARWRALSERVGDIQISTIDAFCFSLLREFPLEAGVDPAFDVADETEMARFANEAMDLTLRAARRLVIEHEPVRLLVARVKASALSSAVASLVDRRHVALPAVASFVKRNDRVGTAADVGAAFVGRVADAIGQLPSPVALVDDGPHGAPGFRWIAADLAVLADRRQAAATFAHPARVQQLRRRLERYFLTKAGTPRRQISKPIVVGHFRSADAKKRHEQALAAVSPAVHAAIEALDADLNVLLARGLLRILRIAIDHYERRLEDHALLDFAALLDRSVALLSRQEEFARSRLKLQARYHHVLVDEFQDTSRLQWRLIDLLIHAWGEGEGTADAPTSIFVVGDRKQSIYRFRHAEVTLFDEAVRRIGVLRPGRVVRQAITTSFRAVPELLAFVNALSAAMIGDETLPERFSYAEHDCFPVPAVIDGAKRDGHPVLGLIAAPSMAASAAAVADEIASLIGRAIVRDRSGAPRPARPDDIAILFRARAGHQYFEEALESRGVRSYVYKGLGFFDAPEVQDLQALLGYLAAPDSDLAAAEFLRSRLIRVSDAGLARLAPSFAAALTAVQAPAAFVALGETDRAILERTRDSVREWLALSDRVPPSELIDRILADSSYLFEIGGRRLDQARENIKKVRALIRRVENRGYATLGRLAAYFETLSAGDEANATIEAAGAVNLMTIHAAKGLEFPIVFLVNLHLPGRGRPTGFSVIERGADGQSEVAFNQTDGTRLEERREMEELRRLLYVATTRARDRLYLAAEVDSKGRLGRAARSLGALLPVSLTDLFGVAAASPEVPEVVWAAPSGRFAFRVCRPSATPPSAGQPDANQPSAAGLAISSLLPTGRRRAPATADRLATAEDANPDVHVLDSKTSHSSRPATGHERLVGTLVHRLFQRAVPADAGDEAIGQVASALVTPEERADGADLSVIAAEATRLYRTFRRRADVAALIDSGRCFYEVPFSHEPAGRPGEVVRGVIDALVVAPDGSATVLELKTGAPRPEHEAQAALYGDAVRAALGLPGVTIRVLYT